VESNLDREIDRVNNFTREMMDAYVAWGPKIKYHDYLTVYGDLHEFVNLRMETADSCLGLIERGNVGDALGLSRSLLENYLLFILMCRGRKFFKLEDVSGERLTDGQFKARVREKKEELRVLQEAGTAVCLEVKRYPRAKDRIMYIFEGMKDENLPGFVVPVHFFEFQNFRPETMRLKDEDYFQYYDYGKETKQAIKKFMDADVWRYKHYLSYDSLLHSLEINGLMDTQVNARIDAHYTFLGKFLHPTHGAVRELHERSNYHQTGRTAIGLSQQRYTGAARLLASLYVCYLIAGMLDEVAGLIENAPAKYVVEAATGDLRALTQKVPQDFDYFWFLFNEPPLHDRFNYCVNHGSAADAEEWGGYAAVPGDRILFNQHIYSNFSKSLDDMHNIRWGAYKSPLGRS
jgi:hypothetical protein